MRIKDPDKFVSESWNKAIRKVLTSCFFRLIIDIILGISIAAIIFRLSRHFNLPDEYIYTTLNFIELSVFAVIIYYLIRIVKYYIDNGHL